MAWVEMDKTKAGMVVAAGLRVARCCGVCANWRPGQGGLFGVCIVRPYAHGKHSDEKHMPAHRFSVCDPSGDSDPGFRPKVGAVPELRVLLTSAEALVENGGEP